MTPRQAKLLAAIVREYSNNAEPIGSEEINQKYNFGVSSATIRNEMMALEKMGYIEQPHTSAGRIPTDLGYRYFINELMKHFEISIKEQKMLRSQLVKFQLQTQEIGRNIAKLLAEKSDQAAFALLPEETSSAGLSNIFNNPNLDKKEIIEIADFFDNLDMFSEKIRVSDEPGALIGQEHHLAPLQNYSLIVSQVLLPSGKKGVIGIIGHKSMRYDKNLSLVEYIAKLLSSGTLMILLILLHTK
ncbi:MAG: heat-inducible transcription repressor HrcA, heat-inducible transcriptional repressor [Candidatus Doudnabacteria bacterium]|nr:heat-inducible transcription repressor HrcA, heat-inducible transcriptional repressor [Candidatus Doudnabacteria bacterium]